MELIDGKNKEQFKIWLFNDYSIGLETEYIINYGFLNKLPFEMQIGVYLAYYDSLGIDIIIDVLINDANEKRYTCWVSEDCVESCDTRNEAYKEAFKKCNEIINQKK